MAELSSESSSDESFIGDVQSHNNGIQPYQFEPRRATDDSSSGSESETEEESSTSEGENHGRLSSTEWCYSGHCSVEHLRTDRECVCCREKPSTQNLAVLESEEICVLNNTDFQLLCSSRVVLRTVLVGLNNVRADNWDVNPANNRGLRYAVCRQFTWWPHGKLGPGRRRVIPACVTNFIKETFPKGEDEDYAGFSQGNDSACFSLIS